MQFHKVTFNNYKVYLGEHHIDCSMKNKAQPIILIGGETGAGKTSLLEGIKLCLYGRNNPLMLKGYTYKQFLSEVHNKVAKKNKQSFSVAVEYKTNKLREIDIYRIERSWKLKKDKYVEELSLSINGDKVESISASDYQEEINETFPAGVGDLLFFDSENFNKIPDFLENGFFDSLNKFLGIDVYRQLSDDLVTVKRHHINLSDQTLSNEFSSLNEQSEKTQKDLDKTRLEAAEIKKEIVEHDSEITKLKKQLEKISGDLALEQEMITNNKAKATEKISKVMNEKRALYSDQVPFLLVKKLYSELIEQLESEKTIKTNKAITSGIRRFKKELFKSLDNDLSQSNLNKIDKHWSTLQKPKRNRKNSIIHDISDYEFDHVKSLFKVIDATTANDLDKVNNTLKKVRDRQTSLTVMEKSVDSKGVGGKLFYEIKEHERLQDINQFKLGENLKAQAILNHELEKLEINIQSLEKKLKLNDVELQKKTILDNAENLLIDFSTFLSENRFKSFKSHFLKTIKGIATKKDLVSDIRIDQKKRIIQFLDRNNNPLSVKDFSAGESQVVAFSLMWAVNVSTKKYFPIVTDSPFNRLDSDHRKNFVENILKKSNHQFIFLSTNEEIGNTKTMGINKYISNTFLIEYDKKTKTSKISNKYFA